MSSLTQAMIVDSAKASRAQTEDNLRKQLAYLYRIFDYYQWSDLIVTHLSVRVPAENALLILPFGVSFKEITPENLIKVDFDGNVLTSHGGFDINHNGTTVHRALYRAKPDVNCILHTHSHYGVTVSNLEDKLMLLDQIGMMFYNKVGYHDFETLFINDNEQDALHRDLKNYNCMILKNHGLLTVGNSITEAFWFHYYLELTCKIQVMTMSTGGKIKFPSEHIVKQTAEKYDTWRNKNKNIPIGDAELLFEAAKRQVGNLW